MRAPLLVVITFVIAVIAGIGYGALEYQIISGTIAKAEQLTEEGNYDKAIEKLELVQERWLVEKLGIKRQEIKQLLKDQIDYKNGVEKIKERNWEGAKELFLNISEKSPFYSDAINKIEVLEEILSCEYRKGEYKMKVFDSQGRVTGVVNGELKEEIPGSMLAYNEEDKTHTAVIFDPRDTYIYEFYAVKAGNYQFTLISVVEGEATEFYLENIPILVGATHRVQVDKKAIEEGKEGAVLLIDADSDGEFEEEIAFGKKLTCEEFIVRTKIPEIEIEFPALDTYDGSKESDSKMWSETIVPSGGDEGGDIKEAGEEARDSTRKADMRQLLVVQEMYWAENDHYYQSVNYPSSIPPGFMVTPTDPSTNGPYGWINNITNPQKFCAYAAIEGGGFYIAGHCGNFVLSAEPTNINDCCP